MLRVKLHDPVYHFTTHTRGKVIEVNEKWGWYKVKWADGHVKEYADYRNSVQIVRVDHGTLLEESFSEPPD